MSTNKEKAARRFPNNLREARDLRGLTQQAVADAIGVTVAAYQNYEYQLRDIRASVLARLAGALDCSVDYLLGIDPEPHRVPSLPSERRMLPVASRETVIDSLGQPVGAVAMREATNGLFLAHPRGWWFLNESSSMDAVVPAGSLLLADPDAQVRSGHVALVSTGPGELVARRVFFDGQTVILRTESHDRDFSDARMDVRDVRIIGRIVSYCAADRWKR